MSSQAEEYSRTHRFDCYEDSERCDRNSDCLGTASPCDTLLSRTGQSMNINFLDIWDRYVIYTKLPVRGFVCKLVGSMRILVKGTM